MIFNREDSGNSTGAGKSTKRVGSFVGHNYIRLTLIMLVYKAI